MTTPLLSRRAPAQYVFVAGGFGFDDVAGRRRTDFLVRREQYGDRQRRRERRAGQLPDGLQRQVIAALHVVDAGASIGCLRAPFPFLDRASRMRCRWPAIRMRVGPASDAEIWRERSRQNPAGRRCVDGRTMIAIARGQIEHALDGLASHVRLAFHPATQACSMASGQGADWRDSWMSFLVAAATHADMQRSRKRIYGVKPLRLHHSLAYVWSRLKPD